MFLGEFLLFFTSHNIDGNTCQQLLFVLLYFAVSSTDASALWHIIVRIRDLIICITAGLTLFNEKRI